MPQTVIIEVGKHVICRLRERFPLLSGRSDRALTRLLQALFQEAVPFGASYDSDGLYLLRLSDGSKLVLALAERENGGKRAKTVLTWAQAMANMDQIRARKSSHKRDHHRQRLEGRRRQRRRELRGRGRLVDNLTHGSQKGG